MPPGVVTVTSTVPAECRRGGGGDLGVARSTVKAVAAVVPKSTAVAPVKSVPVMVTDGAARGRAACSG